MSRIGKLKSETKLELLLGNSKEHKNAASRRQSAVEKLLNYSMSHLTVVHQFYLWAYFNDLLYKRIRVSKGLSTCIL